MEIKYICVFFSFKVKRNNKYKYTSLFLNLSFFVLILLKELVNIVDNNCYFKINLELDTRWLAQLSVNMAILGSFKFHNTQNLLSSLIIIIIYLLNKD